MGGEREGDFTDNFIILEKSINSPGVSQGVSHPIKFFALSSSGS
jgi:hypothetical protein